MKRNTEGGPSHSLEENLFLSREGKTDLRSLSLLDPGGGDSGKRGKKKGRRAAIKAGGGGEKCACSFAARGGAPQERKKDFFFGGYFISKSTYLTEPKGEKGAGVLEKRRKVCYSRILKRPGEEEPGGATFYVRAVGRGRDPAEKGRGTPSPSEPRKGQREPRTALLLERGEGQRRGKDPILLAKQKKRKDRRFLIS